MKKNRILSILFFVIISIASFITVGQAIWVLLDKYVNNYKPEYYPVDIDEKLESVYDGEDIVITLNEQESDYDINVNHLIADLTKEKVGWEYYSVSDEKNDGTKTIEPMNKTPIDVGEYIVKFYYETLNDNPETDEVEWDKSIIRTVSHTITPKIITISEDLSPSDVVYGDEYETETKELSMNYYDNEIYDRDKDAFRSYLKTENGVEKFKVDVYSKYNTNDVNLRSVGDYDCYINLEHPNYIFEYTGENSLHITPRPVSFSFDKGYEVENFVYDNTTHTPNYTFGKVNGNPSSGLVYGETSKSITEVSFKIGQGENPEGYVPTDYYPEGHIVSLTLNENYKLADQSTELAKLIMITKRPVDIYWETLTTEDLVYDKNNNEVTPSFVSEYEDSDEAGIIPGDDLEVDTIYKLEGTKVQNQINVGNYTFEATLKGSDSHNYEVRNDTYDSNQYVANAFEVTPRPVTVNFGTNEYIKTYDATNFTPASGASFDNVVSGDTLNPVVNYFDLSIIDRKEYLSGPKDAGKYIAIITLPETETAKNYKLVVVKGVIDGNEIYVDATEDSKEVEIERKSLIVTFGITQFFKVYDKEGFDIGTTTFNGLQGGETLTPIVNYYKGTGNSANAISEAPVYYNADNYEARVTMPSNEVAKNYYLADAHNGEEKSHIAKTLIINRREILINYKDGQAFNKIYDKEPFEAGNDAYFSNASTNNDSKSPWVEDGLEINVEYYNGLTKLDSAPINYSASNYAMFASAKENDLLYNYVVTNNNKEQALVINKRPVAVDWNEESIEFEYLEESTQNPSYTFAAIEGNANSGLISGDELSPSKDYFGGPTKTIYDNNEEIVLGKTANASSLNRDGEYPKLLDGASAYTVKFSLDDTFKNGECANINYTISANDTSHAYYIKATPIYGALTAGDENVRQNLSSTQTYSSELEQFTHDYTYTSEPISPTGYAYKANDVNKTPLQNANLQVVVKVYDEEDNELANENHVDVGSYVAKALTLSGKSAGSYELVGTQNGTFNIKPKVLEITWSGEEKDSFGYNYFTYNKQEKILSYNVLGVFEKDASNVSFSSANVSTALNANVDNIGNVLSSLYQTKVSMLGDKAKNYCFADADLMENATKEKIGEFKIYPSVIEITVANKTDYIYGDSLDYSSSSTDFSFEITSGIYYESSLNDLGTPTYSSTYVGGTTNAGENVDILVAFDNFNKNYHISDTKKGKLTVNQRPVVLAWADNQGLIYNGRQQIPSASISNRVYNDDVKAVVTYSETTGVNAGSHSVYVEANSGIVGNRSNNYIFDTRNTLHYVIAKYNIVFDGNNFTLTYGEDPSKNTYSYSLNSNYTIHTNAITNALDTFTPAEYDDNYSRYDDIGEYTIIKVSGLENVNYTVTYNPGKLTVNPKSINVSWNVGTYVYNKTPQGPSVSFVAEQIENNDELKVVATNYGTNAGSYTAGLSFTGDKAKNYSISNPTQSYSIAKASVNKPAENTSTFTYTGFEQTYSLTTNELYTITNDKRTNAGSQDVTIALKDAANYKWNGTEDDSNPFTYKFTIGKADTIISVEVTGSDNIPGISYCELYEIEVTSNADGLVNISIINGNETVVSKENLVLSNGSLVLTSEILGIDLNPGLYKLEVTQAEEENYYGSTTTIDLIVKQALDLYIEDNQRADYDPENSATLEIKCDASLPEGLEFEFTYLNVSTSETVAELKDAGTYLVTATLKENKYYEVIDPSKLIVTFTINKIASTITVANNQETTYNGKSQEPSANWIGDGNKSVMYSKDGATATTSKPVDAGTYTITYYISEGTNYLSGETTITYKINKANPVKAWPTITGSYYEGGSVSTVGTAVTGITGSWSHLDIIYGQWIDGKIRTDISYANYGYNASNAALKSKIYVTFRQTSNNPNYMETVSEWVDINVLPVAYNGTYYYGTIEKALNDANKTITDSTEKEVTIGSTIYVIPETNPTIKNDATIESGVSLILPYEDENFFSQNGTVNKFADESIESINMFRKNNITIANGKILTVQGTLTVGGILGAHGTLLAGHTSDMYTQITLGQNSKINSTGTINCYGYIKESSSTAASQINITAGTLKAPFVTYDYRAGTCTAGAYKGEEEGAPVFPLNTFDMPNIHSTLTINKGANYIGLVDVYTGGLTKEVNVGIGTITATIAPKHNSTEVTVVGSNGLFQLLDNATIQFKYSTAYENDTPVTLNDKISGRTKIIISGGANMGSIDLAIEAANDVIISPSYLEVIGRPFIENMLNTSVSSSTTFFPVSWKFDIELRNGNYGLNNKIKILPGGKITVASNANATLNSNLIIYEEMKDSATSKNEECPPVPDSLYPTNKNEAEFIVNGSLVVTSSGVIGGKIKSNNVGATLNLTEASSLNSSSYEGYGTIDGITPHFNQTIKRDETARGNVYKNNQLVSSTFANATYKYSGSGWYTSTGTITFNPNYGGLVGGTSSAVTTPITITSDGFTIPNYPESQDITAPTHYHFGGWYLDEACTRVATGNVIWGDQTLYAKWIPNTYTIEYVYEYPDGHEGGTIINAPTQSEFSCLTSDFTLSIPSLNEYDFDGWYLNNLYNKNDIISTFDVSEMLKELENNKVTLYARWLQDTININYVTNNEKYSNSTIENVVASLDSLAEIKLRNDVDDLNDDTGYNKYFLYWYILGSQENEIPLSLEDGLISTGDLAAILQKHLETLENITLYAKWEDKVHVIYHDYQNGVTNYSNECKDVFIKASDVPNYSLPVLNGKNNNDEYSKYFYGWYKDEAHTAKYEGTTIGDTAQPGDIIYIYGYWTDKAKITYKYMTGSGLIENLSSKETYRYELVNLNAPITHKVIAPETKEGYTFKGWGIIDNHIFSEEETLYTNIEIIEDIVLYAKYLINTYTITFNSDGGTDVDPIVGTYGSAVDAPEATPTKEGYTFDGWNPSIPTTMPAKDMTCTAKWKSSYNPCIIEGTLITMADGTQKPVEEIKAGDEVLVFNHYTGKYDYSVVIYNVHDYLDYDYYTVNNLVFSDGVEIKIHNEHYFYDLDLNRYVVINDNNVRDYIGHRFYYASFDGANYTSKEVTLLDAYLSIKYTRIFGPMTYAHLNSFANGLLNIPGDNDPFINIFEYDENMKYDEELMKQDIEKYGLYTYDDFKDYISEDIYNAYQGQFIKVAVGKGYTTFERVIELIEKYLNDMGYGDYEKPVS